MTDAPQTLMILVDGLGIGSHDAAVNPLAAGACPVLAGLMNRHAVPLDATMGVPGLPQSATGQTALLTGVNAAALVGGHVQGFPGAALTRVIRDHNLFDRLQERGYTATFANAYHLESIPEAYKRRPSVTTVATLKAFGAVRTTADLLAGRAVYQDLTREALRARGYTGPLATVAESARDLAAVTAAHDFTLFEYFQTDRMAHRGTEEDVRRVLGMLDGLVAELLRLRAGPRDLLVITSDHGNIEDRRTTGHTENPVPLVAVGFRAAELLGAARCITDVPGALLGLYPPRSGGESV